MKRLNFEEIGQCECVVESSNRALHNFLVMTHFYDSLFTVCIGRICPVSEKRFVTQTRQTEVVQEKFLEDLLKAHRTTVLGPD